MNGKHTLPADIERTSMAIITQELAAAGIELPPQHAAVVKRVIHTTADFDYAQSLRFTPDAVARGVAALRQGVPIVTDTNMAKAGVSKPSLAKLGGTVACFMADGDVARAAQENGTTRAEAAMEKAAREYPAAGRRKVPMLGFVKEAFLMEKERQELLDLHCEATVDGYTDFIFINRFGQPQHQATLNKAIRRIIRDCNDEQLLKDENAEVLLPHFSCHSLRHTFTTRMCEAGVNVKVIQDTLGHKDISTTLNIYTDVTKELRKSEFEGLDSYFKNEYNKVSV